MPPTHVDRLSAWRRRLAADTDGLTSVDRRLEPVLRALKICDELFLRGDRNGFHRAAEKVLQAMQNKPIA